MKVSLVVLISFFCIIACKKKPSCNGQYTEAPQEFLNYWYFPEGSYWIYKAEDSSLYDTVTVLRRLKTFVDFDKSGSADLLVCQTDYDIFLEHTYYKCGDEFYQDHYSSTTEKLPRPELINLPEICSNRSGVLFEYSPEHINPAEININGNTYTQTIGDANAIFAPNVGSVQNIYKDSIKWQLTSHKINW